MQCLHSCHPWIVSEPSRLVSGSPMTGFCGSRGYGTVNFSLECKMKRVLETDGGDGCTTMCMYLKPLDCILKMVKMVTCVFSHN